MSKQMRSKGVLCTVEGTVLTCDVEYIIEDTEDTSLIKTENFILISSTQKRVYDVMADILNEINRRENL